jgi:prolyl-tRNA editing enzyme YbaK/EbsC (Cys-tRNA(Pro) deacylase)
MAIFHLHSSNKITMAKAKKAAKKKKASPKKAASKSKPTKMGGTPPQGPR